MICKVFSRGLSTHADWGPPVKHTFDSDVHPYHWAADALLTKESAWWRHFKLHHVLFIKIGNYWVSGDMSDLTVETVHHWDMATALTVDQECSLRRV